MLAGANAPSALTLLLVLPKVRQLTDDIMWPLP
jgi:hypothetical protein